MTSSIVQGEEPDQYVLILCNAIGSPVDSKYVRTQPLHVAMNSVSIFLSAFFCFSFLFLGFALVEKDARQYWGGGWRWRAGVDDVQYFTENYEYMQEIVL